MYYINVHSTISMYEILHCLLRPVYTTVILGTAHLINFSMRTHIFVHMSTPDFLRVNAKLKVRVLRSSVLGPPKIWSTDRKFVMHASCFSYCKNTVSAETNYRGKMWLDEATVYTCKSSDVFKELYLSSLSDACIYVLGLILLFRIINNHWPRAK